MKNYYIHTYGCQMNVHESEKLAGILVDKGYTETNDIKLADIILFNTCCIRETAEAKTMGHIGEVKRLKKLKPELIVVVCGCMTQQTGVAKKLKTRFPFVDIILGTNNLNRLGECIDSVKLRRDMIEIDNDFSLVEDIPIYRTSGTNAWVNIIYGCNNFCTYCIVPYVRGRERSRDRKTIVSEVNSLLEEGYKEITLLGQNVDSYGKDLEQPVSFAELLDDIGRLGGKFRLRFMSSHPKDFNHSVIDAIARYDNICKSIHLPVQSGSNRVLELMNRRYTREKYLSQIEDIRSTVGVHTGITSDVMVGFAGETEDDFLDTMDLLERVRYTGLYSFVYSRRKGTKGYSMENQVDRATKRNRIVRLQELQNRITKEISQAYTGNVYEVLVEDVNDKYGDGVYCGRTDCGRLVNFRSGENIIGKFVKVLITDHQSATLWGEIV